MVNLVSKKNTAHPQNWEREQKDREAAGQKSPTNEEAGGKKDTEDKWTEEVPDDKSSGAWKRNDWETEKQKWKGCWEEWKGKGKVKVPKIQRQGKIHWTPGK